MADCNTPPQVPCGPGPFSSPVCYNVPPALTVLNGFLSVTLNADCSFASSEILDSGGAPVVGAVQVDCPTPCGVDCGGTVGVPITVQDEGALVQAGATCLNFVGGNITATLNGSCVDVTVTGGAVVFPLAAPNGSCATPSYNFAAEPSSGMWFDPTIGPAGAVVISDHNCQNRINVGASISLDTQASASAINLTAGANVAIIAQTNVQIQAATGFAGLTSTTSFVQLLANTNVDLQASGGDITMSAAAGMVNATAFNSITLLGGISSILVSSGAINLTVGGGGNLNVSADTASFGVGTLAVNAVLTVSVLSAGGASLQGATSVSVSSSTGAAVLSGFTSTDVQAQNGSVTISALAVGGDITNTAADEWRVLTASVGRLTIDATGAWLLVANPGVAGQVLTSQGPGLPPLWV